MIKRQNDTGEVNPPYIVPPLSLMNNFETGAGTWIFMMMITTSYSLAEGQECGSVVDNPLENRFRSRKLESPLQFFG